VTGRRHHPHARMGLRAGTTVSSTRRRGSWIAEPAFALSAANALGSWLGEPAAQTLRLLAEVRAYRPAVGRTFTARLRRQSSERRGAPRRSRRLVATVRRASFATREPGKKAALLFAPTRVPGSRLGTSQVPFFTLLALVPLVTKRRCMPRFELRLDLAQGVRPKGGANSSAAPGVAAPHQVQRVSTCGGGSTRGRPGRAAGSGRPAAGGSGLVRPSRCRG
jgi:hypothetical protein